MSGSEESPHVVSDHDSDRHYELGDVPVEIDSDQESVASGSEEPPYVVSDHDSDRHYELGDVPVEIDSDLESVAPDSEEPPRVLSDDHSNQNSELEDGPEPGDVPIDLESDQGSVESGSEESQYAMSDHDSDQLSEPGDIPQDLESDQDTAEAGSDSDLVPEPQPVPQTLYQRIQLVVANVRAQEEREMQERGDRPGPEGEVDSNNSESIVGRAMTECQISIELAKRTAEKEAAADNVPPPRHRPEHFPPLPTLADLAEKETLKQLKKAVNGKDSTANYCCGGSIQIIDPGDKRVNTEGEPSLKATAPPVVIRWDDIVQKNVSHRIQFPLSINDTDSSIDAVHRNTKFDFDCLIDACYNTGLGQLNGSQISAEFSPYGSGMIDIINQVILPDRDADVPSDWEEHLCARAKLDRLTVSTPTKGNSNPSLGPSSDPPSKFGTLLVCLPNPHEGGQLEVEYKGHVTLFDWEDSAPNTIQWVAFHKDCKIATDAIESGEQVILAYTLYSTTTDNVLKPRSIVDTTITPLYAGVKKVLEEGRFLKDGCTFAFYCTNQYSHTHAETNTRLPLVLKGIDATIFNVFRTLGLAVSARPVLNQTDLKAYPLDHEKSDPITEYDSDGAKIIPRGERHSFGDTFHPLTMTNANCEMIWWEAIVELMEKWPMTRRSNVIWLNEPSDKGWELAIASVKYRVRGDESEEDTGDFARKFLSIRSHAVILIELPRRKKRPVVLGPKK